MENFLEDLPWDDLTDPVDVFEPEETKRLKTLREFEAEWKVQPLHSLISALALETRNIAPVKSRLDHVFFDL